MPAPVSSRPPKRSRRAEYSDSSSDSSQEDDMRSRESKSRAKKLKRVNPLNPLSTYEHQTHQRKKFLEPSSFVKKEWFKLRGLNQDGRYVTEDDTKQDAWKTHILADKLVKKYGGEVFSDTKVDDGLHSIVESKESNEERELTKLQKLQGSTAHLALYALEGFKSKYERLQNFIDSWVGNPSKANPEFDTNSPQSQSNPPYIWSEQQIAMYEQGQELLTELQVDVAEPIANISRVAAASFIKTLSKRREKVLEKIRKGNPSAATAINRMAPSASHMFGGDVKKLENVVKLNKDLVHSSRKGERKTEKSNTEGNIIKDYGHGSSSKGGRGGGRGKGGYGHGYDDRRGNDKGGRGFRGGNSYRGRKAGN